MPNPIPKININMQWLAPVATAIWAVWTWAAARHGPSSHVEDPVVMRLTSAVSSALSTALSVQQVGPFNFFHAEQKDLGKLLLSRVDGPYGLEFDTISRYEFKKLLASPPLSDSEAVKETLEALRSADDAQALPNRDRLIAVQNHLVELLTYVEKKAGYTLFQGKREKCRDPVQLGAAAADRSSALTAFAHR